MVFIDVTGPNGTRTIAIPTAEITIGSGPDCELQLNHEDVAPHHASVIERGGHPIVLDLGTRTIVDGTPIKEATVLSEDSELSIGPFKLRFRHVDLPPDTVQTMTVRQPAAPPIPMAETDMEILSGPLPSNAPIGAFGTGRIGFKKTELQPPIPTPRAATGDGPGAPASEYMEVRSSELEAAPPPDVLSKKLVSVDLLSRKTAPPVVAPVSIHDPDAPITPVVDTSAIVQGMSTRRGERQAEPVVEDTTAQENAETDPSIPVAQAVPMPIEFEATLTQRDPVKSLLRASDDPIEVNFLRAILEDPDPSDARIVYADWLEERGAVARAEYMRLLDSLMARTGPHDPDDLEPVRLRMLGSQIATPWRAVVAHRETSIEHCGIKRFGAGGDPAARCPGTWGSLIRGTVDDMRRCGTCTRFVHYVTDMEAARRAAMHGDAVVVDVAVRRRSDDLERLPPSSHFVILGRRPHGSELHQEANAGREATLDVHLAECASLEGAAVVAFEHLARDLASLGAPLPFRRRALEAALEETRHAQAMEALAEAHGATVRWAGARPVYVKRSAFEIARENAIEGCVRETYGALSAAYQATHASSVSLREVMTTIAVEERRHAELSWDVARWLEPRLSEDEQEALAAARAAAYRDLQNDVARHDPSAELMSIAGYPSAEEAARLVASMHRDGAVALPSTTA